MRLPVSEHLALDRLAAQGRSQHEIDTLKIVCRYLDRPLSRLTNRETADFLALAYKMPVAWRADASRVSAHLEFSLLTVGVLPRCEIYALSKRCPSIADRIREVTEVDSSLNPWSTLPGVIGLLRSVAGAGDEQ